jgi:hypothetical protein
MKRFLRQHSCKLGVDYKRKLIFCSPEDGNDSVVLTTPALYAWHKCNLMKEEGIRQWALIDCAGFYGEDMVLKILQGYKIAFIGCREIYMYGLILTEHKNGTVFCFDKKSTRNIRGSPFLHRKDVFISYSSKDKNIVHMICSHIELYANCWIDEKNIMAGDSISKTIDEGLSNCDIVIIFLSENSMTTDWVRREYSYAFHAKKRVIPIRIDTCIPPPTLSDIRYTDYPGNEENCIDEIIKAIEFGD